MPKTKARPVVMVDEELCKGCGLCVSVCPRHIIGFARTINSRGFHPAVVLKPNACTGCVHCALMCPDACITIAKS